MNTPERNESDVARLLAQIDAEYQSAQYALSGQAVGVSQHEFITARLENMERAREQLTELVGDEMEATKLVIERLNKP